MSLLGLLLILAAAGCHATWNFFIKRLDGGPELIWLVGAVASVLYLPAAAAIWVIDKPVMGLQEIGFIAGSVTIHMGYFLLLQQGYRRGDLSLVYPTARATGPFLSTGFAITFLGEYLTLQIVAGGLAIIIGVLFLTGGLKRAGAHASASLLFGLSAGTLIGGYTVWDAYTVTALMVPPILLDYASAIGRAVLLAPYAIRRNDRVAGYWRDHRLVVIVIAVFNPLAYILFLYALTFTPVVYAAPTREISVLLTVLMGTILLGEGHLKPRLIWAAVILTGVALLATA